MGAAGRRCAPVAVLPQEVVQAEAEPLEHHTHMVPVLEVLQHPYAVPLEIKRRGWASLSVLNSLLAPNRTEDSPLDRNSSAHFAFGVVLADGPQNLNLRHSRGTSEHACIEPAQRLSEKRGRDFMRGLAQVERHKARQESRGGASIERTSMRAASWYFGTFLMTFIATYDLVSLSQHSRTRPNVPERSQARYHQLGQGAGAGWAPRFGGGGVRERHSDSQARRAVGEPPPVPSPILARILSARDEVAGSREWDRTCPWPRRQPEGRHPCRARETQHLALQWPCCAHRRVKFSPSSYWKCPS